MRKQLIRAGLAAGLVGALALGSTACTTAPESSEPEGVTISIGDRPDPSNEAQVAAFDTKVEQFREAFPDITIEVIDYTWTADTYAARLASGTAPTTLTVPFTEIQGLIARDQIADVSGALEETGLLEKLNPQTLQLAEGADGGVYGVPMNAYALGLVYNRAMFEAAGLDPDDPPAAWDEVREQAKIIAEATGKAGFAQMTLESWGGWMLTALVAAFGEQMQNEDGTELLFQETAVEPLELLQEMRWGDNSMGATFLYDGPGIFEAIASGEVAMAIAAPDAYNQVVGSFGLDPAAFGVTTLPAASPEAATLTGGSVGIIQPDATPHEQAAAVEWINFRALQRFFNPEFAIEEAETRVADGASVGLPSLPVVEPSIFDEYFVTIEDLINVPLENFAPYVSGVSEQRLLPEPPVKAQEMYAALSPVVQAVLTEENADIEALLADVATTFSASLDR